MTNQKDNTNWKGWYAGLVIVLLVQIAIYWIISNQY